MAITNQKLKNIVKAYKKIKKDKPDVWIDFTRTQNSLKKAITVAALSINNEGKRHPHQYRLKQETLNATVEELLLIQRKIAKVKNFDELYQLIGKLDVYGLGKLTRYDIATRIGAYLNLFPDRIYLHAGTKNGANKLLGKIDKPYLVKRDLPSPFRIKSLSCAEIEDILCMYKDKFDNANHSGISLNKFC